MGGTTSGDVSLMGRIQGFMETYVVPAGIRISSNRHLGAIRDGMSALIPFTSVGGFAMLLAMSPVPANVEASNPLFDLLVLWREWAGMHSSALLAPYHLSIGIISVYAVCGISYALAKSYEVDGISNALAALLVRHVFAGAANAVFGNWITYTALVTLMLCLAKSTQLKSVARIALVPCLFNINEPLVFGIPTVLNVFTYVPLLVCSMINYTAYYLLATAGILGKFCLSAPFTVPVVLQAFLATMDWKTIPAVLALHAIDLVVCLPFVRAYDNVLLRQELSKAADERLAKSSAA